ncbi:MAG: PQQ-binding-like beta-propeller repeat protein, partial [Propionibacteriaceae bacterium]|nr:PQQ-binding-like beta-propeller repeat protein [Propionibacteriaceae bacterium]
RWTYAIDPSPVSADSLHRTVTVPAEGAVVVMGEEAIAGIDPVTGVELWRRALTDVDTERGIEAIRGTPYVGSDAFGGQEVAEPDQTTHGVLLTARTGEVALWARELELPSRSVSGAFAGGVLTVGPRVDPGDHPYECSLAQVSLHGLDGQHRWTTTVRIGDPAPTFAKVVGDRLFLGLAPTHGFGDWPATTIVDPATGAVVAQTECATDVSTGYLPLSDGGWIQLDETEPVPGRVRARAMTSSGDVRWAHDGLVSVVGGMVFARETDEAGNVISARRMDPITGRLLWAAAVPGRGIDVRDGSVAVIQRTGAIDDGTRVTILDAETGEVRAQHDVGFPASMWGAEETGPLLLLEDQTSSGERPMPLRVAAFDMRTAGKLWQLTVSRGESAFLHDGQLIVIDQQIGRLYGFR